MSNTEIVVVGAGVAGLSAALAVAGTGHDVTLVTKAELVESNTYHAQGGIAAAIFSDDDPKLHAADTMAAGHGLCDPKAVDILTREGAERVREFAAAGVHFDRDAHGHMLRGLEAAHSRARVVHAGGDATGKVFELDVSAMVRKNPRIHIIENAFLKDLIVRGGHIAGWRLDGESMALVAAALRKLADPAAFRARYGVEDKPVLLFAVGDGNHSLATAKECYERQKKLTPREQWDSLPARYALCELVNLHDASLEFEPIHRVVFGVEPERVVEELLSALPGAYRGEGDGHVLRFSHAGGKGAVTVPRPEAQLEVGTLQPFLDAYVKEHGGSIDYIHGADVARDLAARPGNIAFLLPAMGKEQLFPTVIRDGVLPRKTFSMGEAHDKRFYLEARKIR